MESPEEMFPKSFEISSVAFGTSTYFIKRASGFEEIAALGSFQSFDTRLMEELTLENLEFEISTFELLNEQEVKLYASDPNNAPSDSTLNYVTLEDGTLRIFLDRFNSSYFEMEYDKINSELRLCMFNYLFTFPFNGAMEYSPLNIDDCGGVNVDVSQRITAIGEQFGMVTNDTIAVNISHLVFEKQ